MFVAEFKRLRILLLCFYFDCQTRALRKRQNKTNVVYLIYLLFIFFLLFFFSFFNFFLWHYIIINARRRRDVVQKTHVNVNNITLTDFIFVIRWRFKSFKIMKRFRRRLINKHQLCKRLLIIDCIKMREFFLHDLHWQTWMRAWRESLSTMQKSISRFNSLHNDK